jgi:hypothetical protein
MRKNLGGIFKALGWIAWSGIVTLSFVIDLIIIGGEWGLTGVEVAFFIWPVTLIAAPFWALIAYGTWVPLIIAVAGGIVGSLFLVVGHALTGDEY